MRHPQVLAIGGELFGGGLHSPIRVQRNARGDLGDQTGATLAVAVEALG